MTRKDYVLLYSCFRSELSVGKCLSNGPFRVEVIEGCAKTIAYCLKADNPAFDVQRFLDDCGVKS